MCSPAGLVVIGIYGNYVEGFSGGFVFFVSAAGFAIAAPAVVPMGCTIATGRPPLMEVIEAEAAAQERSPAGALVPMVTEMAAETAALCLAHVMVSACTSRRRVVAAPVVLVSILGERSAPTPPPALAKATVY